jgi:DNA uptake protein ComE-like DNA-binding protein
MTRVTSISSLRSSPRRGSVLVIVMLTCLGLVALTLYFANEMSSELRAADNRVSEVAARQAIAGGARYATYVLTQYATGGVVPKIENYKSEALPVGDANFWFIGRNHDGLPQTQANEPYFALVDEASKLNLNTVTSAMLQALPLPSMTAEFADAIVAWRSATSANAVIADNLYSQLDPPRHNKGAGYETVDELRLINGARLDLILGEDTNRNGALDANEDDGDASAPRDDQNGVLLAGLLEYVTVYSREPATSASGARRVNVTTLNTAQGRQQMQTRLTQRGISNQRAAQIIARVPFNPALPANRPQASTITSVADFMVTGQFTADEFVLVHTDLTATTATNGIATGLVNVNTASTGVLSAIPGIGPDNASALVAYRAQHQDQLTSFAWLTQVLPNAAIRQAGRYITDQAYQFTADIAALAANGRGYTRERIVFDTRGTTPRIVYRQDLTASGWALGAVVRQSSHTTKDT